MLCCEKGLGGESMPGGENLVRVLDGAATPGVKNLFGLSHQQLTDLMSEFGQPPYRAGQLLQAMFQHRIGSLDQVKTLPRGLRQELAEAGWAIGRPRIVETFRSIDGTERYLIAGQDGQTVETVWMPGGDGAEQGDARETGNLRATICVSSQVGCAVNCQFCLTAKLGLQRNLSAGEIAGQVIAVLERQAVQVGRDRINLVFMGMGEPFLNYDEFMAAVRLLVNEASLAESRMTVSTSGIVPGILRFAAEPVRPRLAISLNAPDDTIREAIMPITRKWKIEDVIQAAGQLPLRPRERVTFEYVLAGRPERRLAACRAVGRAGAQRAHAGKDKPDRLESRPRHQPTRCPHQSKSRPSSKDSSPAACPPFSAAQGAETSTPPAAN